MEKLFIPYELAVIAKEKGFPNNTGSCLAAWEYTEDAKWLHFGAHKIGLLQAPLYQQIVDWFREKHKIFVTQLPSEMDVWSIDSCNTELASGLSKNKAIEEAFKLI